MNFQMLVFCVIERKKQKLIDGECKKKNYYRFLIEETTNLFNEVKVHSYQ